MKSFLGRSRVVSLSALLLVSVFSLSFTPFFTSTTNAASTYDTAYTQTSTVQVGSPNGYYSLPSLPYDDITNTWASILRGTQQGVTITFNQDANYIGQTSFSGTQSDFNARLDSAVASSSASWFVSQRDVYANRDMASNGSFRILSVCYSPQKIKMLFGWQDYGSHATLEMDPSDPNFSLIICGDILKTGDKTYNVTPATTRNDMSYNMVVSSNTVTTPPNAYSMNAANLFVFNGDIAYPTGYSGGIPPQSLAPPKANIYPTFDYTLVDKKIVAHYNGPSCITGPNAGDPCSPFVLLWGTFQSGSSGSPLDTKTTQFSDDYTFTYPSNGNYVLYVGYASVNKPPFANLSDGFNYITSSSTFTIDGGSYKGTTTGCTVASGACTSSSVVNCNDLPDFFQQMTCKMSQQSAVGLLNPSINAFKNLLLSFVVPDSPQCNLTLPNVTLFSSYVFPLSGFSNSVCSNATTIRNAFPIVPTVLNFLLSILVVFMIVRIINKLTNNNEHNLIEVES